MRAWSAFLLLALLAAGWLLWPADPRPGPHAPRVERDEGGGNDGAPPSAARAGLTGRALGGAVGAPAGPPPGPAAPRALVGRVVGAGRHPAADAEVVLWVECDEVARGRTDADGYFRFVANVDAARGWVRFTIRAWDADGRTAIRNDSLDSKRTEDVRVRTLVLRAGYPLTVLVEADGQPLPQARVELLGEGMMRQGLVLAEETGNDGLARFRGLPGESFDVIVFAPGYARALQGVRVPREAEDPYRVVLERPRTVEVEVVSGADGRPVAGVEVVVYERIRKGRSTITHVHRPPLRIAPTDGIGRTRIEGIGRDASLHLGVTAPGHASRQRILGVATARILHAPLVPVPLDQDTLRVALAAPRTVRWPVRPGEVPTPADGTRVVLGEDPRARRPFLVEAGRIEDGALVVDGIPEGRFRALALLPDGSLAALAAEAGVTRGEAIRFRRPRSVAVTARRADGSPAEGLSVWVKAVRDGEVRAPLAAAARTDASGRARVTGLYGAGAEVQIGRPWKAIGRVDLEAGDAHLEITLEALVPTARQLLVALRLDGRPALPDEYSLHMERGTLQIANERPADGVIVADWTPPADGATDVLSVRATGYLAARADVLRDADEVAVDLAGAGRLVLRILHDPGGRVSPGLERSVKRGERWERVNYVDFGPAALLEPPQVGVSYRIDGLAAGLYRARSRRSERTSEARFVTAGQPPPAVTLDLRTAGTIRGVVDGPPGTDLSLASVQVTDAGGRTLGRALAVGEDGRFERPLPDEGPVTLTAAHPLLRPAPGDGHATLDRARDDVVLRLVTAPLLHLVIEAGDTGVAAVKAAWIHLAPAGVPDAEPLRRRATLEKAGPGRWHVRAAAPAVGTWRVWLDVGDPCAPLALAPVVVASEDVELGTHRLTTGATIVGRFQFADGVRPDLLMLRAIHQGRPAYERFAFAQAGNAVRIRGLGAGRFRLVGGMVRVEDEERKDIDEIVEVDGRSDLERAIRVR